MRGKVVLFYPPYEGSPLGPPLCLLALASTLREAGFQTVIIDAAIEPNYKKRILHELPDALCLGISVLTGPMIRVSIEVAKAAKALKPNIPIIFGGWHPTLLPDETLAERYVDIVVRGPGERTICEVAEALAEKRSLQGIAGISWKTDVLRTHNSDRKVEHLEDLPLPAYDLVDFDAYERVTGIRKLPYATSVGCPYACNYCTDTVFYNRRFNALSAERVVHEMTSLATKYRIQEIALLDSNFPVDLKRAIAIAKGICDSGVKFTWTFQASTDFICRMSEDDIRLLAASGVSYMGFGTESTSPSVLKLMNKRHQRVDEMYETARRAAIGGIRVTFNLIFGYPGETHEDRILTMQTMTDIGRQFSNINFSPNIFTPYPGIPIWPELRSLNVPEPKSLREWGDMPLGVNILPWLQGEELSRFNRMLDYFLLNSQFRKYKGTKSLLQKIVLPPLRYSVLRRIRSSYYAYPWEIWFSRFIQKPVKRRSLITGQQLPTEAIKAC
ncbi:MAG TPA: radical SAM protein [Edaphobacter sp.]|nr:radical SAM protein [Edaphobacter sp.]